MAVRAVPFKHAFTRAEYYAIAPALDPALRYELLNGTIYALSPANPPHAGVVTYVVNHLRSLDATYLLRVQDVLEIEPDGSPQPDVAVVQFRDDYYRTRHPNGSDVFLVIEVGDTERNPREKMRDYMRDGRISVGWRLDIPNRCVELWAPTNVDEPVAIMRARDTFAFANIHFVVDDVFTGVV